jgi:hypothetical protein
MYSSAPSVPVRGGTCACAVLPHTVYFYSNKAWGKKSAKIQEGIYGVSVLILPVSSILVDSLPDPSRLPPMKSAVMSIGFARPQAAQILMETLPLQLVSFLRACRSSGRRFLRRNSPFFPKDSLSPGTE